MAVPWQKILGIIGNAFHFDSGDGPQLKNNAGVIEAKNSADSAFAVTRGADPVGDDDLVTRRWHNANPAADGSVICVEIPFDFNDVGTVVTSTKAAVVGGRVVDVKVDITTDFDVDPATFEIGDATDSDRYVIDNDVKMTKVGLSEFPQYTDSIAAVFGITIGAAGGVTQGAGRALIFYCVPTT